MTNTNGRLYATCTSNAVLTCAAGYTGTVYSYDSMGRIVNYWQATPYNDGSSAWEMSYNYDLAGDVTSWTHPAGITITNTINTAQEITQIESSLVDSNHPQYLAKSITYTPWGAEQTLENGCTSSSGQETGCTDTLETYVYNNRMQPVMIELGDTSNAAAGYCLVYNYYENVANPTSCAMPAQGTNDNGDVAGVFYQDNVNPSLSHTEAYTYDALNRLTNAAAMGNSTYNLPFSYTADGSGGRYGNATCLQNAQTQGPCAPYTFNPANNQVSTPGFTYDAAGDLTSDGTNTYQYDGEGRLASMNNGTTESYVYNALGAKARIAIQGSPADLFSDSAGAMLGNNGVWSVLWPIAGHAGDIYFQGSDAEFYHADGTHSTRMVNSTAGAVSEQVMFYPWGQAWEHPGCGGWNFASIPWYDTTGGLNLAAHRDYSFGLGRWLSPDPAGRAAVDLSNPQSWNAYAFVLNNPATLTDPSRLHGGCSSEVSNENSGCQGTAITGVLESNTQTGATLTNKHHSSSPVNSDRSQKAAVVYGETSGLRSEVGNNGKSITTPGSDPNLKRARENVADVSARNGRVYSHTPSAAELKNPRVRAAWQASQAAAAASNGSLPGYNFFIRQAGAGPQRPPARAGWGQSKPVHEYGPFINVGGGDVPKGVATVRDALTVACIFIPSRFSFPILILRKDCHR